jgi:type IV pilus assembly protein PilB
MNLREQAAQEPVWRGEEEALKELSLKIIEAALADQASGIHIDPTRKATAVRFRIDGVMHEVVTLPKNVHDPLVTRFKMMGELDTTNKRAIQDGIFPLTVKGKEYFLRECILPSLFGEKATLWVVAQQESSPRLDQLGYREQDRKRLVDFLNSPGGLIIFSGPTGSGRTTAMYAALQELAKPEVTVITVEDPVEYQIPGVIHTSVVKKAGLTFSTILRGIFRSDPNVVMVGDIPDLTTAESAVQLAITGHLVLTQLHALDAPGVIQRLLDMGIEPFMVAQSLLMISAQRLVRKICDRCKQKVSYPTDFIANLRRRAEAGGFVWPAKEPTFWRGGGCDVCHKTGYHKRIGLYEVLVMSDAIRQLIAKRADSGTIRAAALQEGMTTLLADGLAKAIAGQTTVEEVLRVLGDS